MPLPPLRPLTDRVRSELRAQRRPPARGCWASCRKATLPPGTHADDDALLPALQAGDERAFAVLVER